ncbi:MAG: hypothetical protein AABW87_00285, partial [Nanoarchaeota archaeon]
HGDGNGNGHLEATFHDDTQTMLENREMVHKLLSHLRDMDRLIVEARYFMGMSSKEIVRFVRATENRNGEKIRRNRRLTEDAVKTALSRSIRTMRRVARGRLVD